MGGRGSSSDLSRAKGRRRGLSFGKGKQGKPSLKLFPARINRLENTGDLDKMIKGFSKVHSNSPIEYGVAVDEYGYATGYYEGSSGSVNFPKGSTTGKHIVHNHPGRGWGNFSGTDLMTFAKGKSTGITAVSSPATTKSKDPTIQRAYKNRRAGTYKITKTGRFKSEQFQQALRNVKVRDDNYDKDLHKWLVKNQKKYGYKYSYSK